jgi:hypothetical protein
VQVDVQGNNVITGCTEKSNFLVNVVVSYFRFNNLSPAMSHYIRNITRFVLSSTPFNHSFPGMSHF